VILYFLVLGGIYYDFVILYQLHYAPESDASFGIFSVIFDYFDVQNTRYLAQGELYSQNTNISRMFFD